MRIACQEGLLPGRDFAEKVANATSYGFDAIELHGATLEDPAARAERRRTLERSPLKASSICGGVYARFLDIDPAERARARESMRRQLAYAAEVGALGPIFVPIFAAHDRMPDLSPFRGRWEADRSLCLEMLRQIDADAREAGALALIEPLNRYEASFLNRLEQAQAMLVELGEPRIRILADFFHMHIEEADIPQAIRDAGRWIGHVHLADSTRREPGSGGTDFVSGFRALRAIGFTGAMAFECGLSTAADQALPRAVTYLRTCLAAAGA